MQKGLVTRLIAALGNAFGDLADLMGDAASFDILAAYMGWSGVTRPTGYQLLLTRASALRSAVAALSAKPSYEELAVLTATLEQFIESIEGINDVSFTAEMKQQVVALLVLMGLKRYFPPAYYVLSVLGVVGPSASFYTEDAAVYEVETFNLANLKALLNQPATYLKAHFGGKEGFFLDAELQHNIFSLLQSLNDNILLVYPDAYSPQVFDGGTDPTERGILYLPFYQGQNGPTDKVLSISLGAEVTYGPDDTVETAEYTDPDSGETFTYPLTPTSDSLIINLLSGNQPPTPLNVGDNLKLTFADFSQALRMRVGLAGVSFADGTGLNITNPKLDRAVVLTYAATEPLILIGEPEQTRLQADGIELSLDLSVAQGVRLTLKAVNSQLFINGSEGDSFLNKVLPNTAIALPLGISLSSLDGLRFNSINALKINATVNQRVGPVVLQKISVGIESNAQYDVKLNAYADFAFALGPAIVSVSETGVSFGIRNLTNPKDLAFGFDLPKGVGIEFISDTITGGGYLYLDPANHKYAGAAQLSFKEKINLNALGLLQTELPNNQPGYSFLLLITAQFNPIQLGMGFTLNAVGGLVGINRSVSTAFLRSLVAAGRQDTLLFPVNVLDNPQEALATIDSAFPAADGKYVFGLMAKIGWGTPNLITLDAALIIELPAPVRLVLLGILRATLPSESSPIVRIRADFLGIVDFGAKQVSFDATLVDSRILQFVLTGDLAFRLYQGDNPVFVLTAGGFHPAFQPPTNADLPTLRRMTLALAQGGDFRLTLTSYLAITSNTVQFGSRLDLYVGLPASYYIEGFLAFDALFQFNPFHVEVWIGAGVAIKRNGSAKLSIGLSLLVSGPGPWHVAGEGSFKILFFRIRFRVDRTFGSNAAQPALPTTNVRQLLLDALHETANWEIEAPAARASSTTVLRTEESPTELVVDPGGALLVRQKLVPLGFPIEVYGNTRPINGSRFVITSVLFGEGMPAPEAVSDFRDAFAPAQFQRLSDAQKLSAPSFQLLRNGIRVEALDGLVGSGGTTQTVKFELKVIEPAPADTDTAGRLTTGGITIIPSTFSVTTPLPGASFQGLARNGAVGRSRRSYEQRRPSRKAPDQVLWDEDAYAVVLTRNLQLAPGAPNPFVTEAEATAYLTQQLELRPALAGAWQVVPVYQLDVSAPAVAATLATA